MAKITDIYKQYKITPILQLHQLKVAAVAKTICNHYQGQLDKDTVITACLLHDMGNIIKFDLGYNPQWLKPEGQDYWQKVQDEFKAKYGEDEHQASLQIAQEIGASQAVINCIDAVGFSKIEGNYFGGSAEQKICNYCDMRVAPRGVVSFVQRMEDGAKRYQNRPGYLMQAKERQVVAERIAEVETQIFSRVDIKPGHITDKSIAPLVEELKDYQI